MQFNSNAAQNDDSIRKRREASPEAKLLIVMGKLHVFGALRYLQCACVFLKSTREFMRPR